MIVKISKPLCTFHPSGYQVLIYDKDRTFQLFTPCTEEWLKMFGDRVKVYCNSHRENKQLIIDEEVDPQDW